MRVAELRDSGPKNFKTMKHFMRTLALVLAMIAGGASSAAAQAGYVAGNGDNVGEFIPTVTLLADVTGLTSGYTIGHGDEGGAEPERPYDFGRCQWRCDYRQQWRDADVGQHRFRPRQDGHHREY